MPLPAHLLKKVEEEYDCEDADVELRPHQEYIFGVDYIVVPWCGLDLGGCNIDLICSHNAEEVFSATLGGIGTTVYRPSVPGERVYFVFNDEDGGFFYWEW